LTEQQPEQEGILNTKLDYNVRHFGDHDLSSRNNGWLNLCHAAQCNEAGSWPTLGCIFLG